MMIIERITEIGCKFIKRIDYNSIYHSYVFQYDNDIIIIDNDFHKDLDNAFDYSIYCKIQNEYMKKAKRLFRFVYYDGVDIVAEVERYLQNKVVEISSTATSVNHHHFDNTVAEKALEDAFVECYGNEALYFLHKEYEFNTGNGKNVYIDYFIETSNGNFALEANGVSYHHPCIIDEDYYIHLLEKQNTLVLLGLKVFRFSLENLQFKEQVVEEIKEYIGSKKNFIPKTIFRSSRGFTLYNCQSNALSQIDNDRLNGKYSSLIVLPTAAGKSEVFLSDLDKEYVVKSVKRVLIMVPTIRVKEDWNERIKNINKYEIEVECYNTVFNFKNFKRQDYYDYILVDEAHHSQANNVKATIQYFKPKYLLGLTATDERLDNKKLQEIFGEYEVTLSLKQAVEQGIVSNIRAYRLESNINLKNIRYNGIDYNYADLEKNVVIDSRNELIAETLKKYFFPRKDYFLQGIVFCVNKEHCIRMAKILNEYGINSKAVYGGNKENTDIFEKYNNKEVQFLCSCQLINEGWDSPQTTVIVMARPTLSKVMYQQQLGRGLRKHEGKECMYLIDVVDDYQAQLKPINYNSLFKIPTYRPFEGLIKGSFNPVEIFGLSEHEMALKQIDIFTFEEKFADYFSLETAARELYIGTNTLASWNKKKNYASMYLPVGNKLLPYFSKDDILKIRIDHPECIIHTDEMILSDFISFIDENTLTFSFKLVFLLSCFSLVNITGEINLDALVEKYRSFYLDRIKKGLPVDKKNCIYTIDYLNDLKSIKRNMLDNPLEKFERKRFFYYSKDLNVIAFNSILWGMMTEEDKITIKDKIYKFLKEYYKKYGGMDYEYKF